MERPACSHWNWMAPTSSEGAVQVKVIEEKSIRLGLLWVTPPCEQVLQKEAHKILFYRLVVWWDNGQHQVCVLVFLTVCVTHIGWCATWETSVGRARRRKLSNHWATKSSSLDEKPTKSTTSNVTECNWRDRPSVAHYHWTYNICVYLYKCFQECKQTLCHCYCRLLQMLQCWFCSY